MGYDAYIRCNCFKKGLMKPFRYIQSMIRLIFILCALSLSLIFWGCADEPYRIEDSVCGKFLASHSDIVKNYQYISCFDSTHVVYQLKYLEEVAFLANVHENQIGKRLLIEHPFLGQKVIFSDLDTIKAKAFKQYSGQIEKPNSFDTLYTYQSLKNVLKELEGLSESEFEQKIKSDDTLYTVMNFMKVTYLFSTRFSIARKNDSTFFMIESNNGEPNRVALFSRDGKEIKSLFSFLPLTNCFEHPLIYGMKPIGTDSTFSMKFSYVREEENNKEYEGFISIDLKNDSLSYSTQDSLTRFRITHNKANGDSVFIAPQFKESDLEKSKRRKCIGHFF